MKFRTDELASLLRPLLRTRSLEDVFGGDSSAIRAAHTIIKEQTEFTQLKRADRVCTAAGRPDLLQLLKECP